jgi:hypothetical protein
MTPLLTALPAQLVVATAMAAMATAGTTTTAATMDTPAMVEVVMAGMWLACVAQDTHHPTSSQLASIQS